MKGTEVDIARAVASVFNQALGDDKAAKDAKQWIEERIGTKLTKREIRAVRDKLTDANDWADVGSKAKGSKGVPVDREQAFKDAKKLYSQDKTESILSNIVSPVMSNTFATLGNIGAILNGGKAAMLTNAAHNAPRSAVHNSFKSQLGDIAAVIGAVGATEKAVGDGVSNTIDTVTDKFDRAHGTRDTLAFSSANPDASGNVYNVVSKNTPKAQPVTTGVDVQNKSRSK